MESFFTNRHGGFSHGDYSSWNLASHVGDDPADVELNRAKLRERVGEFAIMSQVHGDTVVVLDVIFLNLFKHWELFFQLRSVSYIVWGYVIRPTFFV